jgi:hypothetical protein
VQARHRAEQQFPVRVRIAVPPEGFGRQIEVIYAWLDETRDAAGWATARAEVAGVVNKAIAFYFTDAAFADAFLARFCCGYRIEAFERTLAISKNTPARKRTSGRKNL